MLRRKKRMPDRTEHTEALLVVVMMVLSFPFVFTRHDLQLLTSSGNLLNNVLLTLTVIILLTIKSTPLSRGYTVYPFYP